MFPYPIYFVKDFQMGMHVVTKTKGQCVISSYPNFGVYVGAIFWKNLIISLEEESGYSLPYNILDCADNSVSLHRSLEYKIPYIIFLGESIAHFENIARCYGGFIMKERPKNIIKG